MPIDQPQEAFGSDDNVVGMNVANFGPQGLVYDSEFTETEENKPKFFLGVVVLVFATAGDFFPEEAFPPFEDDLNRWNDT